MNSKGSNLKDSNANNWIKVWVKNTAIGYLKSECIRDGEIEIPEALCVSLVEAVRYAASILDLYRIEKDSSSYKNWMLILLDIVYEEVFNPRCAKRQEKRDCRLGRTISQLDFLFQRVDSSPFLQICRKYRKEGVWR
ncbi:hypothetical protein F0310_04740 (plasmid) [Borrelia sp. A-FGy1]|uniref:hypothetical protein n=1 Tax=Borrelia sp. A-FGy1 TaxID=2608247 RepID=UPI0015F5B2F2|nr:hypothetical protein [Borrelia sp. A-FGy1]QMU99723.1 hypothetical protein F0310_04740 [Borrelia sp. A-FGy1]